MFFTIKNLNCQDVIDKLSKIKKFLHVGSFKSDSNTYASVMLTKDVKEYQETLKKFRNEFDENLLELEIYPTSGWLFLNRLNYRKVLF